MTTKHLSTVLLIKGFTMKVLFSLIETIVEPMDMTEASALMSRLLHFGMYYGHPLLVQQLYITHVSKMSNNSETVANPNRLTKAEDLSTLSATVHESKFPFFPFYLDNKWLIFSLSLLTG